MGDREKSYREKEREEVDSPGYFTERSGGGLQIGYLCYKGEVALRGGASRRGDVLPGRARSGGGRLPCYRVEHSAITISLERREGRLRIEELLREGLAEEKWRGRQSSMLRDIVLGDNGLLRRGIAEETWR